MYSMLSYYDPFANDVSAVNSYTLTECMCGEERGDIAVLDWAHVSAVSFSEAHGLFVISMRNLDTVAAIDSVTGAMQWTLSSHDDTMPNSFAWQHEGDKFYNVHGAYLVDQVLRDGSVALTNRASS